MTKGVVCDVKKVIIRGTDLEVFPIGLGTNAVGGQKYYPDITDEDGRAFLRTALTEGVDFWDTAFTYGPMRSETIIGEVLHAENARNKVVLASKAAHRFTDNGVEFDNSPEFLERAVEESMDRLQTDWIDLFYIHYPDEDTPKYEAVGALERLKEKGIIRAIGVSNFSAEQLAEANQDGYVDVVQDHYNLLHRSAEEILFPYIRENNMSFVPYFPFASGILAGNYTLETTFAEGDTRLKKADFQGKKWQSNLEKVDQLREIADAKDVDVAHLVLAWYLTRNEIDVVIPGAKRTTQVINNMKAAAVALEESEIIVIDGLFREQ